MYRLWNALPLGQWVSAAELRRLTEKMHRGTRHSALAGLVARNLVQRRPSRANLNAYDYLRLPEDAAVEKSDGPPGGEVVLAVSTIPDDGASPATYAWVRYGADHPAATALRAVEAGGTEPFAPPISGGTDPTSSPPMSATYTITHTVKHGTARRYVDGCRCVDCTRAYKSTMKALGLES